MATLPVTVLVDQDTANDFVDYLGKCGYGFNTQSSNNKSMAAKLIVDARDLPVTTGSGESNCAYSTADTMQKAMEEMLNSTRKDVLTKKPEEQEKNTTESTGWLGRYGTASCVWYKGHPFWAVEVHFSNGGAALEQGKETKTVDIEVDSSLIKFHIADWKLSSGVMSTQILSGTSAVPEINIPNFAPEKANGVEYTCPPEILTYTINTPELFTISADGVVTAYRSGMASLTVALKEDPQVKQTLTFQIAENPAEKTTTETNQASEKKVTAGTSLVSEKKEEQTTDKASSSKSATQKLPKASITSLKSAGSRKAKLKWKKCSKISGYQIQYSTNKKFKKYVKVKTVGKKKTSLTLSGLKKKKIYYVRIRTYKKSNGSKVYGKWSKVKKIKIKK